MRGAKCPSILVEIDHPPTKFHATSYTSFDKHNYFSSVEDDCYCNLSGALNFEKCSDVEHKFICFLHLQGEDVNVSDKL